MKERDAFLLLILIGSTIIFLIIANPLYSFGMMGSGMMGMMGYGLGFGFLIFFALTVLIAVGAYLVFTHSTEPNRSVLSRDNRALQILKEKYVKGEVTREEYLKMKREIESGI